MSTTEQEIKNIFAENQMKKLGENKYKMQVDTAKLKRQLSSVDIVAYMNQNYIIDFAQVLVDWATKIVQTGQGKKSNLLNVLTLLPEHKKKDHAKNYNQKLLNITEAELIDTDWIRIADASVSTIFDNCLLKTKRTTLEIEIGECINDEIRWTHYETQTPGLVHHKMEDYRYSTYKHIKRSMISSMNKISDNNVGKEHIRYIDIPLKKRTQVGQLMLELFNQEFGLLDIYLEKEGGSKHKTAYVKPTDELKEYFEESFKLRASTFIQKKPITIKPRDWVNCFEGGYHNLDNYTYVRADKEHNELVDQHDISFSMQQTNRIQSVPYRINKKVYEVIDNLYKNSQDDVVKDGEVILPTINKNLPMRESILSQDYQELSQEGRDNYIEAIKKYKELKKQFHFSKVSNESKINELKSQLDLAFEFLNEEEIYFPSNKDTRGRTYPMPQVLNYQSNDIGRSLLEFANGEKINETGVYWLAVSGAGLFDQDKETMDTRFNWVLDNEEMVLAIANDPYSNNEWFKADKPFAFLAFCFEWSGWKEKGYEHITRMKCGRDGSCNGIQWFSGMLLDEISGELVNLTNNKTFKDIYGRVAEEVNRYIDENEWTKKELVFVKMWKEWGIDRSLCKRPTMTLAYNSKFYGWVNQLRKEVKDTIAKGKKNDVFGEAKFSDAPRFLASILEIVMPKVVVAAFKAMQYIETSVETILKQKELSTNFIHWNSPSGFPVYQKYQVQKSIIVKSKLNKRQIRTTLNESTDKINLNKHMNATPPNFVHSCDAAHLDITVDKCFNAGIENLSFVHDEYATTANHVGELDILIRQGFIEINSDNLLANFMDDINSNDITLGPLPSRGNLCLNDVINSEFFFC